ESKAETGNPPPFSGPIPSTQIVDVRTAWATTSETGENQINFTGNARPTLADSNFDSKLQIEKKDETENQNRIIHSRANSTSSSSTYSSFSTDDNQLVTQSNNLPRPPVSLPKSQTNPSPSAPSFPVSAISAFQSTSLTRFSSTSPDYEVRDLFDEQQIRATIPM